MDNKKTVLIIDDMPINLQCISLALEQFYNTACAKSGEKALAYLENYTPDIILLDLYMPNMSGIEFMKIIKENPKLNRIPVIFITAENNDEIKSRCIDEGAVGFIQKPFIPANLQETIMKFI